ncbi:MAG TPA: hypothetical protein VGB05_07685 [Pyrinomonadaceae bacterium]|jgi:hypothetical protein
MKKDKTPKPRKGSAKTAATRRASVRQRAEQIINSDTYSNDTRRAIRNALEDKDDNLAEFVRRAESGEEVFDITRDVTLRDRAERIINSPTQSKTNRTLVEIALRENFDKLVDFIAIAESGAEILDAATTPNQSVAPPPASTEDAGREAERAATKARRAQTRTYSYEDCSRMYHEEHYTDLLNNRERIKGLVEEMLTHGDEGQAVAFLTIVHAASSFENVDDRRELCIQVARACMDDVTDVWGALGATLIRRAATNKQEE